MKETRKAEQTRNFFIVNNEKSSKGGQKAFGVEDLTNEMKYIEICFSSFVNSVKRKCSRLGKKLISIHRAGKSLNRHSTRINITQNVERSRHDVQS